MDSTPIDDLTVAKLRMIPGADVLVARITDCGTQLFPEEQALVLRAVKKRRAEFAAGRNLARTALTEIGFPQCTIPQVGRTPVWPQGIVGSIAHSNEYVAVCVAMNVNYAGVGIDIEGARRVKDDIEDRILTPDEVGDTTVPDARTLRFACKEAVYKAVSPLIGEFFGFHAVRIDLDAMARTFVCIPLQDGPFSSHVANGRGVFMEWRGHHVAAFTIAQ